MSQNPWWHPSDDDLGWDESLPVIIRLAPDYSAPLPLWGEGFGNIDWRYTKFPPALLDRLAAWQQEFDDNYHYETGWRSAQPGTAGLTTPRAWQQTCGQSWAPGRNSPWIWPLDGKPRAVSRIKRGRQGSSEARHRSNRHGPRHRQQRPATFALFQRNRCDWAEA
jgi:hypothetical protein